MCGLNKRSNYPEFKELANKYDVLCFVETKTDDCDQIDLPGFQMVYMKNRASMSNRRSGGIACYVKNNLISYVKVVMTECNFILWFEMKGCVLGIDDNMLYGIVYITPENSIYSSPDAFTQIENELLTMLTKYKTICCLTGDFNSRISNDDCIYISEDDEGTELLSDVYKLQLLKRNCMDTKKNNYGNILSDLCKYNNIYILNGRVGEDRHVGIFTCKNSSVVDYCIGTSSLLGLVDNFCVLEFSSLFSDVHCPLCITLRSEHIIYRVDEMDCDTHTYEKPRKWDSSKKMITVAILKLILCMNCMTS